MKKITKKKENFIWQVPFLFLFFIAILSTSLSELTKGIFLLFLIISFFVKERRKIILEKLKQNSFLLKLIVFFFITHFITCFTSGFYTGYWGDSKIGIINHMFGVFIPHVIIFFYSYFFLKINFLKKNFVPFLILIITITVYSLIHFWSKKTNLPLGIYGRLTTHSQTIAIFFSIILSIIFFSLKEINFATFKNNFNKKKYFLLLLFFLSIILLILEFKNSFSRTLFLFLLSTFLFFIFYFFNWKKVLILSPFIIIFTWLIAPKKIKEKIYMNINFYLEKKSNNKIQEITFEDYSKMKVYFQKPFIDEKITFQYKYYDSNYFFEGKKDYRKRTNKLEINNEKINTNSFSLWIKVDISENSICNIFLINYKNGKIQILKNIEQRELHKIHSNDMKTAFKEIFNFKKRQLKISVLQGERSILWQSAKNVIKKNFLMGYGFRSWRHFSTNTELNDYAYIYQNEIDTLHYYIHNNFLDLWYGNGLFNLLVFIFLLICIFGYFFYWTFIKKNQIKYFEEKVFFVALLIFFQLNLIGIFDISLFVTSPIGSLYWFVIALLLQNNNKKLQ